MPVLQFSIGITDGQGKHGTTRYYADVAGDSTLTEAVDSVAPFLGALNGVTAGVIDSGFVTIPLDLSGLTPNTPGAGVFLASCGVLSWPNVADEHPWDFVVPAVASALVSGDQLVQTEGGTVDLLTDIMGAAFTSHAADDSHFTDEDGAHLALEPRGFHSFRKFGKRIRRARGSKGV